MNSIYSSTPCQLTEGLDSSMSKKENCGAEMQRMQGPSSCGNKKNSDAEKEYLEVSFVKTLRKTDEDSSQKKVYRALRCNLHEEVDKTQLKYDHVTYRNPFRVTGGPIYLVGVEFFGPGRIPTTDYRVVVRVETPTWAVKLPWHHFFSSCFCRPKVTELYGKVTRDVETTKGEMWQVLFDYPICIPPETWIEVNFQIQGTTELLRMKPDAHKTEARIYTHDGVRQFHFLAGSCQMPVINFIVDPLERDHEERLKRFSANLLSSGQVV